LYDVRNNGQNILYVKTGTTVLTSKEFCEWIPEFNSHRCKLWQAQYAKTGQHCWSQSTGLGLAGDKQRGLDPSPSRNRWLQLQSIKVTFTQERSQIFNTHTFYLPQNSNKQMQNNSGEKQNRKESLIRIYKCINLQNILMNQSRSLISVLFSWGMFQKQHLWEESNTCQIMVEDQ